MAALASRVVSQNLLLLQRRPWDEHFLDRGRAKIAAPLCLVARTSTPAQSEPTRSRKNPPALHAVSGVFRRSGEDHQTFSRRRIPPQSALDRGRAAPYPQLESTSPKARPRLSSVQVSYSFVAPVVRGDGLDRPSQMLLRLTSKPCPRTEPSLLCDSAAVERRNLDRLATPVTTRSPPSAIGKICPARSHRAR
jgi:hypothetical protein